MTNDEKTDKARLVKDEVVVREGQIQPNPPRAEIVSGSKKGEVQPTPPKKKPQEKK